MKDIWLEEILKNKNIPTRADVSTKTLSTFQIGGVCRLVIEPRCQEEFWEAITLCQRAEFPYAVIGRGSNLLFQDGYLSMALIRTVYLNAYRVSNAGIWAECGVLLPYLSRLAATHGSCDLVFAAGIPGTVGGGIFMNAGAHNDSLCRLIKSVDVFSPKLLKKRTVFNDELSYSYRKTEFQEKDEIVLCAEFALRFVDDNKEALSKIRAQLAWRKNSQPLNMPSAGSAFLRPCSDVAISRVIDELGLKGMRCGNAAISCKHAGFIVNLGGATASDVLSLIDKVQNIVEKERGFRPIPEIRLITDAT